MKNNIREACDRLCAVAVRTLRPILLGTTVAASLAMSPAFGDDRVVELNLRSFSQKVDDEIAIEGTAARLEQLDRDMSSAATRSQKAYSAMESLRGTSRFSAAQKAWAKAVADKYETRLASIALRRQVDQRRYAAIAEQFLPRIRKALATTGSQSSNASADAVAAKRELTNALAGHAQEFLTDMQAMGYENLDAEEADRIAESQRQISRLLEDATEEPGLERLEKEGRHLTAAEQQRENLKTALNAATRYLRMIELSDYALQSVERATKRNVRTLLVTVQKWEANETATDIKLDGFAGSMKGKSKG